MHKITALYDDFAHFYGYLLFLRYFYCFSLLSFIFTPFISLFYFLFCCFCYFYGLMNWFLRLHCMLILHIFLVICNFYCFSQFSLLFTPSLRCFVSWDEFSQYFLRCFAVYSPLFCFSGLLIWYFHTICCFCWFMKWFSLKWLYYLNFRLFYFSG